MLNHRIEGNDALARARQQLRAFVARLPDESKREAVREGRGVALSFGVEMHLSYPFPNPNWQRIYQVFGADTRDPVEVFDEAHADLLEDHAEMLLERWATGNSLATGRYLVHELKKRYSGRFQSLYLLSYACLGDGTESVADYLAIIDGMPPISEYRCRGPEEVTNGPAIDDSEDLASEEYLPFSLQYYSAPAGWMPRPGWFEIKSEGL